MVASVSQAVSAAQVTRVRVTVSAPDISPPRTAELSRTNNQWQGVIGALPVGSERLFVAEAYDADNRLLFSGQAMNVTITAETTVVVSITLQPEQEAPTGNVAPIIDALVASASSARPGQTLTLQATAHDPNPDDLLTYAWAATAGTFGQTTGSASVWTAPQAPGVVTLRLTVMDPHGAASSMELTIPVQTGVGNAEVIIRFNTWPHIAGLSVSPSPVAVGQAATALVSAGDAEGNPLSYAWSADGCTGSWEGATQSVARFTPDALPTGAPCSCSLTVSVSDGQGGATSRSMALCVQDSTELPQPPAITEAFQSAVSVPGGGSVTLRVAATNAQGGTLTFSWEASQGTLGTPSPQAGRSEVVWTAPPCVPLGPPPTIQATVLNEQGLSTPVTFTVTGVPSCIPQGTRSNSWSFLGGLGTFREEHAAALLPSGKVLIAGGASTSNWAELHDGVVNVSSVTGPTLLDHGAGATLTVLADGRALLVGGEGASTGAELYDPDTETWTATGSLTQSRVRHTATRLPSGRVLVMGGPGDASAEVYDPETGTWASTSPMPTFRTGFAATLLPSGRVLVTGGYASATWLATAELYDPATGTWSSTSPMGTARAGHTATVLESGRVLVAGGTLNGAAIRTAELYDPVTGTWSATGAMTGPRSSHQAVLMPSRGVFVAGGLHNTDLATAELYDPGTGAWTAVPAMRFTHANHTLTLLPSSRALVAGGRGGSRGVTELYDPAAGQWTSTSFPPASGTGGILPSPGSSTTLLPSGDVFVPTDTSRVALFHPTTMEWTPLTGGAPVTPVTELLDSDRLFVLGAFSTHLYERSTNTWTSLSPSPLATPRRTVTRLPSGRILALGSTSAASGYLHDLASDTWSPTSPLHIPREDHAALLLPSGQVMVAGGRTSNGTTATVELYDPATDVWTVVPPMHDARLRPAAVLLSSGQVFIASGDSAELYDPATATWSTLPSPPEGFSAVTATLLDSGRVLLVGGNDAVLFDPATRTWTPAGGFWTSMGHMAQRLPSGQVLAIRHWMMNGLVPALYTP